MVPVFCAVRVSQATAPPGREPHAAALSCVDGTPFPITTKSPQPAFVADVVNSGQFASSNAWLPPQSCVRQTENDPWKIDPAIAACGSAMIGGEKKAPSGGERVGGGEINPFFGGPLRGV